MKNLAKYEGPTNILKNVAVTIAMLALATTASAAIFHFSQNSASVGIIYVLAVMLIARFTDGYVPGIISGVISVVCVNYVFTYPFMKLNFTMDGYPVTFIGMMAVSSITSMLTTQFKTQNRMLNEKQKLLMEAEKETMRANLLRAVSHDLRTPLTSIIGMAAAYLENESCLTEKERLDMVRGISEDANWLLNMVENLLSVTRIRVGDAQVNTSPEPLEEVVSEAVQRTRKRLPKIRIQVKVPEEFLMVPMDATLIEQVIINLLENAYYHSGVEEIIDFFVEKKDGMVEFHIRDYGQGIALDRLKTIFDGGGMEQNRSGDSHKGMGIGLTICKTIVNAHHGEIYAANRERGAEFVFKLPLGEKKDDK